MSCCRFGNDSDVYMYHSINGIECCACRLTESTGRKSKTFDTVTDAAKHLKEHEEAGHKVPSYAYEYLE